MIEELETLFGEKQNQFIQTFIAVLVNSPFKETRRIDCHCIPLRKYLQYGCILHAAFKYITRKHKVKKNKAYCKCCICVSSFSPEDLELIFLENICKNVKFMEKKENFHKVENLIRSIDKNSLILFKKNSCKFEEISEKVRNIPSILSSVDDINEEMILGKRGN